MINKFEIKSHDGPGRIGKLNGEKTPKLFYKTDLEISPSEGSAYNIEKEIARLNIKETLKLAEINVEKCNAAVIQGSKYIDLRIECLKELEELGYNIFIIANGDELLTNPKELVDIIVNLRINAHPSSMLVFTFAEILLLSNSITSAILTSSPSSCIWGPNESYKNKIYLFIYI